VNCQNCQREIAADSNFCYLCGARQVAQRAASPGSPLLAKRLMRSVVDCKIAGVCGGIAEYLEVDSTLVRLVWVLLVLMPVPVVPALIGYFVAWLVMPKAPMPLMAEPSVPRGGASPHSAQPA
jgi:phage shock protein C